MSAPQTAAGRALSVRMVGNESGWLDDAIIAIEEEAANLTPLVDANHPSLSTHERQVIGPHRRWAVFEDEDRTFCIVTEATGDLIAWPTMNEDDCERAVSEHNHAIEAQARTGAVDVEPRLLKGVLRFYAEQMPAYAVAAGLNRDEFAAVMVDVNRVRAILAAKAER